MDFCNAIESIARRFPKNIAVQYRDISLSYYNLEIFSSNLAKQLIDKGIKLGDVVGLGLFNGPDVIVGMLGILKAGGVYLPLDPNYPYERIKEMIFDANAKLIIVNSLSQKMFESYRRDTIFIEHNNKYSDRELPIPSPAQPAYIIYTSGSTGKPKGIVVSHRALTHAALSFAKVHPLSPHSLLSGSISFDPSILVISHALVTGGKICLYNNREGIDLKNFDQIIQIIKNFNIDFMLLTPSFYSHILREKKMLSSLKNVFLCGEKIGDQLIHNHISVAPNANLYNTYGPSEYAIGSTLGIVYDAVIRHQYPVTIGRPFCDNKIYVLDNELNPVDFETKGEFFVSGPGLASGYLNQKSLTDEKFIVCNHLENQSLKLYKTGDFGYQLENGEFVFLGRKDCQVKINGHRVELEEIESKILMCSKIDRVAAVVSNDKLIVFYSIGSQSIAIDRLTRMLKKIVPSYMIPHMFFKINDWPITNNGKIDKKALSSHWLS